MTSLAMELLWDKFQATPHTRLEIFTIMRTVPELAEVAAQELLKHPDCDKDNLRQVLTYRESEPSGVRAARKLLAHPEAREDDWRLVINSLGDGLLGVKAAKAILCSSPSPDTLAMLVNTFRKDDKLWGRAAFQLACHPEATDGNLATITGTAGRRDLDLFPIYMAIIQHPNAESLTVSRIVLDGTGDVRNAALDRYFAFKRERLDDRFWQVLDRLGGDEKWLAKATRQILRLGPNEHSLYSVERKLGSSTDHEKFWRQFLAMKNLSLTALVELADRIKSARSYTALARRILRNPDVNTSYFSCFQQRLGHKGAEKFWLTEMEKPDFPTNAIGFLLTKAPAPRVQELAGQRYLEQEDDFWRRLTVYECGPGLQKQLKPSIIKGIGELPSSDLPNLMRRSEEFGPLAWEELKRRPEPEPLRSVIMEHPNYMAEAWVLFKACPDYSKWQLERIGDEVPSLAGEVESILRSKDNSYLIEEMQSLSRRN